jgi:hypothetical protein
MNNKGIRSKVLLYVEQHPKTKRAEIMAALSLDDLQVSNALAYWRDAKQLFPSGRGCNTTWSPERPEPVRPQAHQLMAIFG